MVPNNRDAVGELMPRSGRSRSRSRDPNRFHRPRGDRTRHDHHRNGDRNNGQWDGETSRQDRCDRDRERERQPVRQGYQQQHYGPGASQPSFRNDREPGRDRERDQDNRKRDREGERRNKPAAFYFDLDNQNPTQCEVDEFFRKKPVLHFKEIPSIFLMAVQWKKKNNIDVLGGDKLPIVTENIVHSVAQLEGVQFINAGHLIKLTMATVNGLQAIAPTNIHMPGQRPSMIS